MANDGSEWSKTVQRHTEVITIDAPPERIYDLVADLARVDELSPEVRRAHWVGQPAAPVVGARIRGYNRWRGFRWSREAVILVADRGGEFAFRTVPGRGIYHDETTWRYEFEPTPTGGTQVTESYEFRAPEWLRRMDVALQRPNALAEGMRRTLRELKQRAEDMPTPPG
jgi:polyketide cyclase/dehydrase/lipid transport protein